MRPPEKRGEMPFGTASPPGSSLSVGNLHISPAHALVFVALRQKHGEAHARAWLETEQQKGRVSGLPTLKRASDLLEAPKSDHEQPANPHQNRLRSPDSPSWGKIRHRITPLPPSKPVKTLSAQNPAELAEERMARLTHPLPRTAKLLYRVLLELGFIVAQRRGYAQRVSRVTLHCPLEIVAFALGVHRTTIWRNLEPLTEAGLIACSDHTTTVTNSPSWKSNNITDGKLWCIKLDPASKPPARLSFDDLKTQWRDLGGDIERGRTAFNQVQNAKAEAAELAVQQSSIEEVIRRSVALILEWALPPLLLKTPSESKNMTVAPALEAILDLPGAERHERNDMVDASAKAICHTLGDTHPVSLKFYRRVLWNLLRRYDQDQDYFMSFYEMILRARADYQEGFGRKTGALLHSRLKAWPVWEELQRTPPVRVGVSPLRA